MKSVHIILEDEDFNKLKEKKGEMNWHDFILLLLEVDEDETG